MADHMTFPKTAEDFIKQYSFKDEKQEYTNGAELMPVFRVKQMMEHYFPEEVAHGRWLYDSGSGKYFCSACDEYALSFKKDTLYGGDLYEVCLTDYCPNCGARMDGGNDDDL